MPEYTPELRAKVDAAMAKATIIAPEICDIGDYDDFDGTGIVILDDDMRIAAFHQHKDAAAYVAAVNAIAPYTAHIDAQAERIAELEAENARLRKGLDLLERQCAAVANSRSAPDNIRFMLSQGLMRARVALKDTAQ